MNRAFSTILRYSLLIILALPFCAYGLIGDADANGVVEIEDARFISRFIANQIPALPEPNNADVTQDGSVDIADAFSIAKYVAGHETRVVKIAPLYGSPDRLQIGDLIRIELFEYFDPLSISGGSVRITSAGTDYDSGTQSLSFSDDHRSLYYHWDTAGLDVDPNYVVTITIDSEEMDPIYGVTLTAPIFEPKILAEAIDASCPAPGIPLVFRRVFPHDSSRFPILGPLGKGWTHDYNIRLEEYKDGRIVFCGPEGFNRLFKSKPDGSYEAAPGDYGVLTRDSNDIFELKEKNGLIYGFNLNLQLDSIRDLNGNCINCVYDERNRLIAVHHSCGKSFFMGYDVENRLTELKDHAGRITTYQYDVNHPILASVTPILAGVTDPNDYIVRYDYVVGQSNLLNYRLTDVDLPGHSQEEIRYKYDSEAHLIYHWDFHNHYHYGYDPNGKTVILYGGGISTILANERGQPIEVRNPLGATTYYTYDAAYNLTQVTNPLGHTYSYQYDEYGNCTKITDPNGNIVNLGYDLRFHKLAWLEDSHGYITTFEYDDKGNLLTTTYPDDSNEAYTYDSSGNLTSKKNRKGETIIYSYNSLGQLIEKWFPDGNSTVYAYDPNGNMIEASNEVTTITMAYDELGRLTRVEYPGGFYFEYEYDGGHRRTRRTDQDGRRIEYHYGFGTRLQYIRDVTNGTYLIWYSYSGGANPLYKKWVPTSEGQGPYTIYEYDDAGQLLQLTNYDSNDTYSTNDDSVISQFDYTYDLAGNRLTMNTLEGLHQYAYDNLGQLTEVNYPDGRHVEYRYDSAGNRIQVIDNNSITSYVTNNLNQYTSVADYNCTYDLNGNLIQRITAEGTFEYRYDAENRLVEVSGPNEIVEYSYDPFGRRIRRTSNRAVTNFIIDPIGLGNMAAEYDANGSVIAHYDYGYGLLSRTVDFNSIEYYNYDALGSTSEIVDQAGNILNSYTYDPFGISLSQSETLPNPFQYVGEYGVMNEENGLFFMRARYYDAIYGRFISEDPFDWPSRSSNLYVYCFNNPNKFVDPTGNLPQILVWIVIVSYTGSQILPLWIGGQTAEEIGSSLELQKELERMGYVTSPESTYTVFRSGGSGASMGGICPTFIQPRHGETLANPPPQDSEPGEIQLAGKIMVPVNNCLLRSDIPIYGVASGKQFKKYRVEYGEGDNPTSWSLIEESNEPQVNLPNFKDISWMQGDLDLRGNLATWNVGLKNWSHLPWHPPEDPTDLNGIYTIRLVVEDKDGNTIEDRVTCEVGRAIAQCLPGVAISPDKRVIMRFPEQALTHPFRVYTILPLSDIGEKIPVHPVGFKFIGSAYRIREPGDKFAKDVTLEFNTTNAEIEKNIPNQIGICRYDNAKKRWIWLETSRNGESTVFKTILTELPKPKAIYALAYDPAAKRSTIAEPDPPATIPAEPVEPGVLVSYTFEDDFGTFKPRDRFVGAKIVRDNKSTADGTYCLKLVNENHGGNLSCTVLDKSFDVTEYPELHFNYRIEPNVKIDFLIKVNDRWYRLRFTGDEIDYRFRDVNIDNLGNIPEVVADNKWRSAVIDLHSLLRRKTRCTRIDEIILADWQVGGFMKLDFGQNPRGASLCIDNFKISTCPIPPSSPVLLVDNFDGSKKTNALGELKGSYKNLKLPCFNSSIVDVRKGVSSIPKEKENDSGLKLSFNMRPSTAYGGYWTALGQRNLSEYNTLRFRLRTESPVPPMEVGIRNIEGKEAKTFVASQASAPGADGWRDVCIPFLSLKGLTDLTSPPPDVLFFAASHVYRSGRATVWIDDIRFEHIAYENVMVTDFQSEPLEHPSYSTFESGAAAISVSLMPDVSAGPETDNTACRISYGGTIGRDFGMQGGFSYCAWQHSLSSVDARQFKYLTLRIRGEKGGETPNVYLSDCVKRVPIRAKEMPGIKQEWQTIKLPLAYYAERGIDLSRLDAVSIVFEWDDQSGTVYIDDIELSL